MAYTNSLEEIEITDISHPKWSDLEGTLLEITANPNEADFILSLESQNETNKMIIQGIWSLRRETYNRHYPEVDVFENDPHDVFSCIIYTRNQKGKITSTARIAYNGKLSIPEKQLVPELVQYNQEKGVQFAELGRLVISDDARGSLKNYFRAFYHFGTRWGIDSYVMFVQQKWISFYQQYMDAQIVSNLTDVTFGSDSSYVCMVWSLSKTTPCFFQWCKLMPYQNQLINKGE